MASCSWWCRGGRRWRCSKLEAGSRIRDSRTASTNKMTRPGHLPRTARIAAPALLLLALIVIGCGSSSRTTPADVHAIAAAEHRFLVRYGHARKVGIGKCAGKTGTADTSCYNAVVVPRQSKAAAEFLNFSEALLDAGVGPKCAEALEEIDLNSLPEFPGEATSVCRSESQQ